MYCVVAQRDHLCSVGPSSTILDVSTKGRYRSCPVVQVLRSSYWGALRQVRPARPAAGPFRKVRPAPKDLPGKYETGTQNHEGIAGTLVAANYLAQIGEKYGQEDEARFSDFSGRRLHLKTGMTVLREYDHVLSAAILDELEMLPGRSISDRADRDWPGWLTPMAVKAGMDPSSR
jgi:selenocysteine lyase/cysteine desulfurase